MFSSQKYKEDIILALYKDSRTVFRLKDIAMITGEDDFDSINKKLNYNVRKGRLGNPRKGIYTKDNYDPEEMACRLFIPSYIMVDGQNYWFRKIKDTVMVSTTGIERLSNHVNIATPERAFLDILYVDPGFYFDNTNPLDKKKVMEILPIFDSKTLTDRTLKLIGHD